jgi:hypothetical protein
MAAAVTTAGSGAPATRHAAAPAHSVAFVPSPVAKRAATGAAGVIRGAVLDRTPPEHPVAGQRVRLEIVERGSSSTRTTTTDPRGRFAFPGLPLGGLQIFLVRVQYGGVPYTARAVLTPAVPAYDMQLSVFEPTRDRSAVVGAVALGVIESANGALRVSVIQRLENATARAVVMTDEDPLVFPLPLVSPLPRGAAPVEFVSGWHDPQVTHDAITDTLPVLPGAMELAYSFGLEPSTRTSTLRWVFPYGATDVEMLVADRGIGVSWTGGHADGIVTEHGQRYARWSGGPVPPGGAISVRLDGLPVSEDRWPGIAAGVLALALACGLAVALRRPPAPA